MSIEHDLISVSTNSLNRVTTSSFILLTSYIFRMSQSWSGSYFPSFISRITEPDSKALTVCHWPAGIFKATTCPLGESSILSTSSAFGSWTPWTLNPESWTLNHKLPWHCSTIDYYCPLLYVKQEPVPRSSIRITDSFILFFRLLVTDVFAITVLNCLWKRIEIKIDILPKCLHLRENIWIISLVLHSTLILIWGFRGFLFFSMFTESKKSVLSVLSVWGNSYR